MNRNTSKFPIQSLDVWQDVKRDIERKILSGTYEAGERVPSTRKIAEDYGVGQSTAQKVLSALELDGIIESRRGIGYYVKPYIREKLYSEKKHNLEQTILNALSEAELLDIDLLAMVKRYKSMKRNLK